MDEALREEPCVSQRLTIEIPDDVYHAIEKAAKPTGQAPHEWLAKKLRSELILRRGSPTAILQAMREPPHVSTIEVDELEKAIATGKQPVRFEPVFDEGNSNPQ
jgi:hypothetical protein